MLSIAAFSTFMSASQAVPTNLWETYKDRFVSKEGRVIDTGNGNVSHSEGQGYGMLLAEANDDKETFDRLWEWTRKNLQVRSDKLFCWRWRPAKKGGAVDDKNNASDGDILIAWALIRADKRWNKESYKQAAAEIARDIRKKLIKRSDFGTVLLPGETGFEKSDGLVVNPSYWVFPAFEALDEVDASKVWSAVKLTGLRLIEEGRFGERKLPPDWLCIHKYKLSVAKGFDPVYGYNAIRIPLYLRWDDVREEKILEPFISYSASFPEEKPVRATVDLKKDKTGADPVLPGMQAVYDFIRQEEAVGSDAPYSSIQKEEPYYSASLGLLVNIAARETQKIQ